MDGTNDTASIAGDVHSIAGNSEDGEQAIPELSREEIQRLDKERITKLRKLKMMLGLKRKAPPTT
jgi:hypothetical protein